MSWPIPHTEIRKNANVTTKRKARSPRLTDPCPNPSIAFGPHTNRVRERLMERRRKGVMVPRSGKGQRYRNQPFEDDDQLATRSEIREASPSRSLSSRSHNSRDATWPSTRPTGTPASKIAAGVVVSDIPVTASA